MIKAIITDFDGTLVDTFEANYIAYKKAFKIAANYNLTPAFYKEAFGLRIDDICAKLNITNGDVIKEIKEIKAKEYANYVYLTYINNKLLDQLEYYQKQGIKIALATTASSVNLYKVLDFWKIHYLFDIIISGDDVKHGKPDPEVYIKALEQLGIDGSEALIFEDSEPGIEAASKVTTNIIKIKSFS